MVKVNSVYKRLIEMNSEPICLWSETE